MPTSNRCVIPKSNIFLLKKTIQARLNINLELLTILEDGKATFPRTKNWSNLSNKSKSLSYLRSSVNLLHWWYSVNIQRLYGHKQPQPYPEKFQDDTHTSSNNTAATPRWHTNHDGEGDGGYPDLQVASMLLKPVLYVRIAFSQYLFQVYYLEVDYLFVL